MLTQILVDSADPFTLHIANATPKDSFLVRKITGLNPPDVNLFLGDFNRDGGIYQGRRVGMRNVVMTLDLNPNPILGETISSLREKLYKAFLDPLSDADYLKIVFYDDALRVRYLVGFAEKIETEIFDAETSVQISLICPDPFIRDNDVTSYVDTVNGGPWSSLSFDYNGTAGTGFYAKVTMTNNSDILTLDNNGVKMVIDTTASATHLNVGQKVYFTTIRGSRDIRIQTGTNPSTPLVASLTYASPWIELSAQANELKVYGATSVDQVALINELTFTPAYWGV